MFLPCNMILCFIVLVSIFSYYDFKTTQILIAVLMGMHNKKKHIFVKKIKNSNSEFRSQSTSRYQQKTPISKTFSYLY